MSRTTFYLAALRDGEGLVYLGSCGRWLPLSAFRVRGTTVTLRKFKHAQSAIELAALFAKLAKRGGCGWRVEMVTT